MTTVKFYCDKEGISGFLSEGHSGFSEQGYDIVCAAISACITQTHILLEDILNIPVITEISEENTSISIKLPRGLNEEVYKNAQNALLAFKMNMLLVEEDYSGFIKVLEV